MAKIRGTITSTTDKMELNPTLSAADFDYPVPPGVRLTPLPAGAAGRGARAGTGAPARAR